MGRDGLCIRAHRSRMPERAAPCRCWSTAGVIHGSARSRRCAYTRRGCPDADEHNSQTRAAGGTSEGRERFMPTSIRTPTRRTRCTASARITARAALWKRARAGRFSPNGGFVLCGPRRSPRARPGSQRRKHKRQDDARMISAKTRDLSHSTHTTDGYGDRTHAAEPRLYQASRLTATARTPESSPTASRETSHLRLQA